MIRNLIMGFTADTPPSTGWDLSTAVYDNKSFSVAGQSGSATGLYISEDGSKAYITSTATVYQYNLSVPFDISTAVYSTSSSIMSQDATHNDIYFQNDGAKFYTIGSSNDKVYRYSMSTPWAISTRAYDNTSFSVATQTTVPTGVEFSPDGKNMFVCNNGAIYRYTIAVGFEIDTAQYIGEKVLSTGTEAIRFSPDGLNLYDISSAGDNVSQYKLSTAWDIDSAGEPVTFSIAEQDAVTKSLCFSFDGKKMYILGQFTDTIYQYSLGG